MTKVERVAGILSFVLSVIGGAWFVLVCGASAMSDSPDSARSMPLVALPLPSVAFLISALVFVSASRRRIPRAQMGFALPALVISVGTILLLVAVLFF